MIERGKYQSLTMINWNGFFARTFDIDNLVTTLSGGNGAGKSTTMASFITALIPDQSLLHFRNTTEAGSSSASRDKGLYGKLQPGVCYSVLEVINSRNQRLLFVVKLQQVAGRDKKVDIKPLLIQGLPSAIKPAELLTETLENGQARVRQLSELKEFVANIDGVQFKAFNSIVDYHAQMFELGALPKKLRNSSDRSKYYKLIEASLYGGISSAITRSLRDYLLPQNGGVKKAFQDMETALRENRATLEAINTTQRDRDLFKHLLTESTNYVAADYMRHANERSQKIEQVLIHRQAVMSQKSELTSRNDLLNKVTQELSDMAEQERFIEQDLQSASDHLQLMQTALRQQEKIHRYQDDLEELSERLEEQMMVVEEAQELLHSQEEQLELSESEVDSLKTQLADYQQALDIQQTRALQYQQAIEALNKASDLLESDLLDLDEVTELSKQYKDQEAQVTEQLLAVRHTLDISQAAQQQFEQAFALVNSIAPNTARIDAHEVANQLLQKAQDGQTALSQRSHWQSQQKDVLQRIATANKAQQLLEKLAKEYQLQISQSSDLELEKEQQREVQSSAEEQLESAREERAELEQKRQALQAEVKRYQSLAPKWIQANDALYSLNQQIESPMADANAVMQTLQWAMEQQQDNAQSKLTLQARRTQLDTSIEQLGAAGGANDARLKQIADSVGGVLLSEIYDDIAIEDAPYFSAMYGPARNAIVVSNLDGIAEKLQEFDDCPDDVYLLEGDVDAFDDSGFAVEELEGAVCVQVASSQLRYSRFPAIPIFGRAAREARLEQLRDEREQVQEAHAIASFDEQKYQRLCASFNQFVAKHVQVAFEDDPEQAIIELNRELNAVQRRLEEQSTIQSNCKVAIERASQVVRLLDQLTPIFDSEDRALLAQREQEIAEQLQTVSEQIRFVETHGQTISKLKPLVGSLSVDPELFDEQQAHANTLDSELKKTKSVLFALSDILERRAHFSYSDSVELLDKESEMSEQLKRKLAQAEHNRTQARDGQKQQQQRCSESNQILASLKSAHQAKQETLQEFKQEIAHIGIVVDEHSLTQAESRKHQLAEQLTTYRQRKSELERTSTATELELKSLVKSLKKAQADYQQLRTYVVNAKAGWCSVLKLAKHHDVERRLHKRELAYLSEADLRSMSDKSLGALRLAVANEDDLRDSLRASEDTSHPERKVLFYISVYQYLRQRIRQDIIHTDDPVEAIEEMEIELARLTDELNLREQRLAISSESVATIIKKTIQREQNRIRMLNQGLSNIAFGQVKGVRLNVSIRESHQSLLKGLYDSENLHSDLFENARFTFSEAMAKLFQRVNPHVDVGQRSPQVLGEELLDYRNYLELSVEVNRGTDGWLQAESGALSTGEAIGTGQSILLMVVQSWEEESRRLRSKDILPCRLLFLDEAARLDAKSIATLFELCHRLNMQLLIAAPENISPDKGTTYKLVRKVFKDHEHVHVVGLKGFAQIGDSSHLPKEENVADPV
ncbi:cell division protein MukB [Vibrio sp. qd031]|uniref:chromosome partition protein MukB n=1 Tax=Vibrio sp. qd031 TaxID=1603038 RepID=UPI000A0FA9FF|nr:chromosome partition protein MukB [Vibrio sp. qd031]ORT49486.1 cell division protein MukB [Vibrio sp. qd031]